MSDEKANSLVISDRAGLVRSIKTKLGQSILFLITSLSTLTALFIFYFIAKDAIPFFQLEGFKEFSPLKMVSIWLACQFGALSIFVGSSIVVIGSVLVSVPLGIAVVVRLSDLLPFKIRQIVKPVIEILAAIPSCKYGLPWWSLPLSCKPWGTGFLP